MKDPNRDELKELLLKCWMTHDGMWFLHCLNELGMETTNRLNKAASSSLAAIEVKRIMQATEAPEISSFENFKALMPKMFDLILGDFMDFTFSFPGEDSVYFEMGENCFALNGMKRMGVEKEYECGIFNRVEGWFDALNINWTVQPKSLNCMMLTEGRCNRTYQLRFPV